MIHAVKYSEQPSYKCLLSAVKFLHFLQKSSYTILEVIDLDYAGFYEFPFPSVLSDHDREVKNFFFSLSDDMQLKLLNGSRSYESFHDRVTQYMSKQ